jgi:hemoglobin-like flavoprotein
MTPDQIAAVQKSFSAVLPIADQAGIMFYQRLFATDPRLRTLFSGDISAQSEKLMQMIGTAVYGLYQPETIIPTVRALGARHAGYGVSEADYETVAAALMWTLERGLGPAFTPEVAEAWVAAYTMLADTMKAAARDAKV